MDGHMDIVPGTVNQKCRMCLHALLHGFLLFSTAPLYATGLEGVDLAELSFEELANIEITSVSKRPERLLDAAASVFVISADDIRRSGVNSIPEALRLAPNLEVARVNANIYAITSRGFNNALGNKLLVLIDGRTVYTPLYSGVNWDMQNLMLEDVDRIEVISGPGATLWGANAVNGVINIITRSSEDTQGVLAAGSAGNMGYEGSFRYGGKWGDRAHFRVYATGFDRQDMKWLDGTELPDGWQHRQAGFRSDWSDEQSTFTAQGDIYDGEIENVIPGQGPLNSLLIGDSTVSVSGMNLLGRWGHQLDNGSNLRIQAYYDHTERDDPRLFGDREDTFDIQLDHALSVGEKQRILWGGGYRYTRSNTATHFNGEFSGIHSVFGLIPEDRNLKWFNLFVQDEVNLGEQTTLTVGIKAEHNIYTGFEFLPNLRLAWKPDNDKLLWGSLSRAVRAPARYDRDFTWSIYTGSTELLPVILGGPDFQSEVAEVLEVGYRSRLNDRVSFSVTAFYSDYDKLRSGQPAPAVIENLMEGTIKGIEGWGAIQITQNWRLNGGFTLLDEHFTLEPGSLDPDGATDAANDPEYSWNLRSSFNLSDKHELDVMLRCIGPLPAPEVPGYTALDVRLGWRVTPAVDLSLVVQNLNDEKHPEFFSDPQIEIGRSVSVKVRVSL
jgi:iron complex outermembrane receptor protein